MQLGPYAAQWHFLAVNWWPLRAVHLLRLLPGVYFFSGLQIQSELRICIHSVDIERDQYESIIDKTQYSMVQLHLQHYQIDILPHILVVGGQSSL